MQTLNIEQKKAQLYIQLHRGRANPINQAMVDELLEAFRDAAENESVAAVLLAGQPGFFSAGLDLIEIFDYNEAQIAHFWNSFAQLMYEMAAFPKPLVAAITGHSPAGGCVLACCCDYRVMSKGEKFRIGLNEIPVGIVLPRSIFNLFQFWVGSRQAYQSLMEGKLFSGAEAQAIGLVDELCPAEEVLSRAEAKLQQYASFARRTWSLSKQNLRADLLKKLHPEQVDMELTTREWWSESTRKTLEQIIQRLRK